MRHIVFSVFWILFSLGVYGQEKAVFSQLWSMQQRSNENIEEGWAGSCFGKHKNYFIWAGGSYFPEGKPWQGGKKFLSDDILVFEQDEHQNFKLIHQGKDLPYAVSDAAFVSIENKGVLCIGGQTPEGLTPQVFLISFKDGTPSFEYFPELPIAVKSASAAIIKSKVYLLGGQTQNGTSVSQFLELDLEHLSKGWISLPNYPTPVSGAALVAQQDGTQIALFGFGGRSLQGTQTQFFSNTYHFNPSSQKWTEKAPISLNGKPYPLAVGVAGNIGASSVVILGGDTGKIYNKVEKAIAENNTQLRDSLWIHHPGFNQNILVYDAITDTWFSTQKIDQSIAVSSFFSDGKQIYIAGGEQKPGIRSSLISKIYFERTTHFGWINYIVLIAYFVGMLFIGFFFMKNSSGDTEDFFKASGRIPWWAAGISIFATTLSAITFISIPAKTYASDWRMLIFNMSIIIAAPIIIRYFLPFFLRFNFSTAYEYLEARFSRSIRWLASSLFLLFMISRIAIVLFLPSLALNAVTGFSVYWSIILMSIVTIIYSTMGGMEAVIWGDVIQGFILVTGAILAFVFMISGIEGGFSEFWDTTITFHKMRTFDFSLNWSEPVLWVVLLGGLSNTIISYTSDQSVVQRYMTTVNEKATAKSIWLNGIISVPVSILFFLLGTGLFAFYHSNPEYRVISNSNIDSIFPQFIVSEMPIGFAGLLIAAIFAAAMSTLSSNINSASAVITSDFYQTISKNASVKKSIFVAQFSGIVIGLSGMGVALILATWNIASLWDQFNTFLGLITSGLGALFILGIFFPRVGNIAAFVGVSTGIIVLYGVKYYSSVSFLLYGFIGLLCSIFIAVIFSYIFPNRKKIDRLIWKDNSSSLPK